MVALGFRDNGNTELGVSITSHPAPNRPSFLSGELPLVALGLGAGPLLGARAHILF